MANLARFGGICGGLYGNRLRDGLCTRILLRFREQWIAWYICTLLETAINILSGQYILLILKAGYLTNTTYGYIKWTKYIKSHNEKDTSLL